MICKPLKVIDKTGYEVILRNAEINDAEDLIKYLKITTSETPYLIREPDEVTLSLEQEQNFIQRVMDSDRELMLVAIIDGKHIGNCSLMGIGGYRRYQHRCSVAIALYQEYCGRGIGKIMLQTVLEIAKEIGYEQAELEVIADNKNAIALYENLGFEKYGHFPDNMKYENGKYADAYWMMKKL
ncbi:MAG: GNAT family N-acetyltransferase [Lachnospiraceae bacterium]|nr:GNAT family N-acetyltransferase [Lachnospiraceae bacterium]MBD5506014.1 GNAT family N-acetyltransferase [Lachnospiraceae bacterium]